MVWKIWIRAFAWHVIPENIQLDSLRQPLVLSLLIIISLSLLSLPILSAPVNALSVTPLVHIVKPSQPVNQKPTFEKPHEYAALASDRNRSPEELEAIAAEELAKIKAIEAELIKQIEEVIAQAADKPDRSVQ